MANPICTLASLTSGGACYKNLKSTRRQALKVYLMAKQLAANGGTDYTAGLGPSGSLNSAAAAYDRMTSDQLDVAFVTIESNNATSAGATISSNIQTLASEIACLDNFDMETLRRMELLLRCELGRGADYPQ